VPVIGQPAQDTWNIQVNKTAVVCEHSDTSEVRHGENVQGVAFVVLYDTRERIKKYHPFYSKKKMKTNIKSL
jgi:hypothetical protein